MLIITGPIVETVSLFNLLERWRHKANCLAICVLAIARYGLKLTTILMY